MITTTWDLVSRQDTPDPMLTLLLRMQRFAPVHTTRLEGEPLPTSPRGIAYYWAGDKGDIISVGGCFYPQGRARYGAVNHLQQYEHYRTGHHRVRVSLVTDTGRRSVCRGVHALVLAAWAGTITDFWIDACHIDGNPHNNRLDNLVWGDRSMNAADRERHKAIQQTKILDQHGQASLLRDERLADVPAYVVDEDLGF